MIKVKALFFSVDVLALDKDSRYQDSTKLEERGTYGIAVFLLLQYECCFNEIRVVFFTSSVVRQRLDRPSTVPNRIGIHSCHYWWRRGIL